MARKRKQTGKTVSPSSEPKIETATASVPSYYTNNVEIRVSLLDFRLRLTEVLEANQERILRKDLANVYLSPQHAKILATVLNQHVSSYEERFGTILLSKPE